MYTILHSPFASYIFPDATVGILVATVVATDADITSPNNDVNYVITSGAGTDFQLNSVTSGEHEFSFALETISSWFLALLFEFLSSIYKVALVQKISKHLITLI